MNETGYEVKVSVNIRIMIKYTAVIENILVNKIDEYKNMDEREEVLSYKQYMDA